LWGKHKLRRGRGKKKTKGKRIKERKEGYRWITQLVSTPLHGD